jgi:hypothetical protein
MLLINVLNRNGATHCEQAVSRVVFGTYNPFFFFIFFLLNFFYLYLHDFAQVFVQCSLILRCVLCRLNFFVKMFHRFVNINISKFYCSNGP